MHFSGSARAADENFDYLFKIILIGDSNVGKTCVALLTAKCTQNMTMSQGTLGRFQKAADLPPAQPYWGPSNEGINIGESPSSM